MNQNICLKLSGQWLGTCGPQEVAGQPFPSSLTIAHVGKGGWELESNILWRATDISIPGLVGFQKVAVEAEF